MNYNTWIFEPKYYITFFCKIRIPMVFPQYEFLNDVPDYSSWKIFDHSLQLDKQKVFPQYVFFDEL